MSTVTPWVYRASLTQRVMAVLLFVVGWIFGLHGFYHLYTQFPKLWRYLQWSRELGEPVQAIYWALGLCVLTALTGLLLLLGTGLFFLLIEGTHIVLDEEGIAVEQHLLPVFLAKRLGAGRLPWKRIVKLEKGRLFFKLSADPEDKGLIKKDAVLRFLMVDCLDRLIYSIMERSPNLKLD